MELRDIQIRLFEKFAHMYDSGVPLAEALEVSAAELGEPMAGAIESMIEDLYRGSSLADALLRHPTLFGPEMVGILRAGESRGELGEAARSVATGVRGRVVSSRTVSEDGLRALLERAHGATLHVNPGGHVTRRFGDGPEVAAQEGVPDASALAAEAGERAGVAGSGTGRGAFWFDGGMVRVVRVATASGIATTIRRSAESWEPTAAAQRWSAGHAGLALVSPDGRASPGLADAKLIGLAGLWAAHARRVGVLFPMPGFLSTARVEEAADLDPDVVMVAEPQLAPCVELVEALLARGVHVVCVADPQDDLERVPYVRV